MDQAMGDLNSQLENAKKEVSRLRTQLGLPDEPEADEQQAHEEHYVEGQANEADVDSGANAHDANLHDKAANALDQVAQAADAQLIDGGSGEHADADHGRTRDASDLDGEDAGRAKRTRHA